MAYQAAEIDVTFDMRSDARGKDPDSYSPTLRKYHQTLWSKTVPSGQKLDLQAGTSWPYLWDEALGSTLAFSSDTIIRTFNKVGRAAPLLNLISDEEREAFSRQGYTIGAMIIFPSSMRDRKPTINGARGMNRKIEDRFDLSLECIRRHYQNETSPLSGTLSRYSDFFDLFVDFEGYINFFHLQDLVDNSYGSVRFFLPFDDFKTPPMPSLLSEYEPYRERSLAFVQGRNARIKEWCDSQG